MPFGTVTTIPGKQRRVWVSVCNIGDVVLLRSASPSSVVDIADVVLRDSGANSVSAGGEWDGLAQRSMPSRLPPG